MAVLELILYSFAVGILLLAGYSFRSHNLELIGLKIRPAVTHWLDSVFDVVWGRRGTLSDPKLDQKSNELLSLSHEWWQDDGIFQLEKRGIFSKSWLLVTHACRFRKPGDYRTFEIAGFSIIVILGKDRQLRTFQNVCRHRAYQVTKKECGSSTVLGCRYHGWSYDTKGKLVKAPEFETVPGFDKSMNALWEVKTEVINSMVFVNFDARKQVSDMDRTNSIKAFERWDMKDMQCAAEWKIEGLFNWKLALGELFDLLSVVKAPRYSFLPARLCHGEGHLSIGYSATIRQLPSGGVLTLRVLPRTPKTTTVELCIYTKRTEEINAEPQYLSVKKDLQMAIKRIESKQIELMTGDMGSSDPKQNKLRQLLKEHVEAEAKSGMEIHPAAQTQVLTPEGRADDDFCRNLESPKDSNTICGANARGVLDW